MSDATTPPGALRRIAQGVADPQEAARKALEEIGESTTDDLSNEYIIDCLNHGRFWAEGCGEEFYARVMRLASKRISGLAERLEGVDVCFCHVPGVGCLMHESRKRGEEAMSLTMFKNYVKTPDDVENSRKGIREIYADNFWKIEDEEYHLVVEARVCRGPVPKGDVESEGD